MHAKLDFVSVFGFGLNYVAALCAGVETTVRMLMVNSCDSVGTRSIGQQFLPGRVRSRVNMTDLVCSFCTRFTVAFGGRIRHL